MERKSLGIFDAPLLGTVREHRSGAFRAVRHEGGAFSLDTCDEISISVKVASQRSEARFGNQDYVDNSAPGGVAIFLPGQQADVRMDGLTIDAQFRTTVCELMALWMEDHEAAIRIEDVAPAIAEPDPVLAQLICRGCLGEPGSSEETMRHIAGHLLVRERANGSPACRTRRHRGGLPANRLARVRESIETRLADKITLQDLAETAGMSPFHFARAFRQSTGTSAYAHVIDRRLRKAILLLSQNDQCVSEIAIRAGFDHAGHLGRHLRRRFGVSGRELRRLLLVEP